MIEVGKEVIQYVYGTADLCLVYGPCDPCDGVGDVVAFSRSMTRVECFADVSFAPQGGRSVQGVVAMVGAPVQWESAKQTCVSFSTAEAELLSYIEAQVIAENVGSLVEILQEVPGCEPLHEDVEDDVVTGELVMDDEGFVEAHGSVVQKLIYGDSTSAIAVLSLPGGAWRTRHLRLRSSGLREKLRQRKVWALRYLPGSLLVADHFTKPINPKPKWSHFFKFMGMVLRGGKDEGDLIAFNDERQKLNRLLKREVTKIAAATVGVVTLEAVRPGLQTEKQVQAIDEMEIELNDYILARLKVLRNNGFPGVFSNEGQLGGGHAGADEVGALDACEKGDPNTGPLAGEQHQIKGLCYDKKVIEVAEMELEEETRDSLHPVPELSEYEEEFVDAEGYMEIEEFDESTSLFPDLPGGGLRLHPVQPRGHERRADGAVVANNGSSWSSWWRSWWYLLCWALLPRRAAAQGEGQRDGGFLWEMAFVFMVYTFFVVLTSCLTAALVLREGHAGEPAEKGNAGKGKGKSKEASVQWAENEQWGEQSTSVASRSPSTQPEGQPLPQGDQLWYPFVPALEPSPQGVWADPPQAADAGAGAGRGGAARGKGKIIPKGKGRGVFRPGQGAVAIPFSRHPDEPRVGGFYGPPIRLRSRQEVQAEAIGRRVPDEVAEHETSSEGVEGSEVSGSVSEGGTFHLRERIELSMAAELMDVVEEEEAMVSAASNQVQGGEGEEAAEDEVPISEIGLPAASSSENPGPGHAEPEPEGHPRLEGVRLPEAPGPGLHPDPYPGYLRVVQTVFTTPAGSVYHQRRQCLLDESTLMTLARIAASTSMGG